jgi:excisionase family DNA binding protein
MILIDNNGALYMVLDKAESKRFISLSGVASRLNVSKQTVRRLVKGGRLEVRRLNGRILVSEASYADFIDALSIEEESNNDVPISYLVKHTSAREHWRDLYALMRAGKLRCVALEVDQKSGYAQALIQSTSAVVEHLSKTGFDVMPAAIGLYAANDGEEYAILETGGPACPVNEIDPELLKSIRARIWIGSSV